MEITDSIKYGITNWTTLKSKFFDSNIEDTVILIESKRANSPYYTSYFFSRKVGCLGIFTNIYRNDSLIIGKSIGNIYADSIIKKNLKSSFNSKFLVELNQYDKCLDFRYPEIELSRIPFLKIK